MRKIAATLPVSFILINFLLAQNKTLIIEGTAPGLYITHTITPKENFYSIGRMYNISPKELAPFNNLDLEKGLPLGQTIKIPLTQNNFLQEGAPKSTEALIPIYHIVDSKEGLYRVSVNYNKVPLERLKKWNHLSSDVVSNGTKLIVGYLKVSKQESPLAKNAVNIETDVATKEIQKEKKPNVPRETVPAVRNNDVSNNAEESKHADTAVQQKATVKTNVPEATTVSSTRTSVNFNGGIFKNLYEDQRRGRALQNEAGISGVFKSTSGWQDGKYYCFHNQAEPGTIVKVTNSANGKSIYAKVLDLIPDISQNSGLTLQLSNSAAEELNVSDNRFNCSIDYSK